MFSGSVARGVRQLTSQMNDHHHVQGNLIVGQDSAYDLLPCLLLYVKIFSHNFYYVLQFLAFVFGVLINPPHT